MRNFRLHRHRGDTSGGAAGILPVLSAAALRVVVLVTVLGVATEYWLNVRMFLIVTVALPSVVSGSIV